MVANLFCTTAQYKNSLKNSFKIFSWTGGFGDSAKVRPGGWGPLVLSKGRKSRNLKPEIKVEIKSDDLISREGCFLRVEYISWMKLKFLRGNWEESFSAGSQKTPQVAVRTFFFLSFHQCFPLRYHKMPIKMGTLSVFQPLSGCSDWPFTNRIPADIQQFEMVGKTANQECQSFRCVVGRHFVIPRRLLVNLSSLSPWVTFVLTPSFTLCSEIFELAFQCSHRQRSPRKRK